jgi:hypothetical protein
VVEKKNDEKISKKAAKEQIKAGQNSFPMSDKFKKAVENFKANWANFAVENEQK